MKVKHYYERYWNHGEELEDFQYKWPSIKKLIPLQNGIKLFDLGCGKGKVLKEMFKLNPHLQITAADVSETSLAYAKKHLPKCSFIHIAEGGKLPCADNSFDFITALDVLEHIYDTELVFSELSRILKPGGKLLISVPYYGLIKNLIIALVGFDLVYNPRSPHIRYYTKKTLIKEVTSVGLSVERLGYFGRFFPISNGMYCLCRK